MSIFKAFLLSFLFAVFLAGCSSNSDAKTSGDKSGSSGSGDFHADAMLSIERGRALYEDLRKLSSDAIDPDTGQYRDEAKFKKQIKELITRVEQEEEIAKKLPTADEYEKEWKGLLIQHHQKIAESFKNNLVIIELSPKLTEVIELNGYSKDDEEQNELRARMDKAVKDNERMAGEIEGIKRNIEGRRVDGSKRIKLQGVTVEKN